MNIDRTLIALDGDGVLLDYCTAYGGAWQRVFGETPVIQNSRAYWPSDRWGVPRLSGERLEHFRAAFDAGFWSSIPPIPGAVEACKMLVSHGYTLVCVTAIDSQYAGARAQNLVDLGFPITEVIATGIDALAGNLKAAALATLKPAAFVDDYAPYLVGLDDGIHKALIVRDPVGSPNTGELLAHCHSQHVDLLAFAKWWTEAGHTACSKEGHP